MIPSAGLNTMMELSPGWEESQYLGFDNQLVVAFDQMQCNAW